MCMEVRKVLISDLKEKLNVFNESVNDIDINRVVSKVDAAYESGYNGKKESERILHILKTTVNDWAKQARDGSEKNRLIEKAQGGAIGERARTRMS